MRRVLLAAMLAGASAAHAQVAIEKPWARATAPGATVGGGFMTIRNSGTAPDRLVGASSPAAARVELHVHIREGEVMKMREVSGFDVPAGGAFVLRPGGPHLMFIEIRQPFREGDRLPVTLRFEKAGEVGAELRVGTLGGMTSPMQHQH